MISRAYTRCNSGHYFIGPCCPFDGWSSDASWELTVAVERLSQLEQVVSLEALRKAGVSAATLARTIVVEFGSSASAFEALDPNEYVVNGEARPPLKLGRGFK
jgi:hypothetical protein